MGHADFVAAAVASADDRIKGTAFVLLEKATRARSIPGCALASWCISSRPPRPGVQPPRAGEPPCRGYTVRDGVVAPNCTHGEIIDAVFRRTRVTVA